ncbi:Pentatricopeptide repeat-containing protein [Thalictrum thalictroides]|uniref:Pentatricopeptide repeat-containing protein n=1 Tax=Thalictrum thalictroides TaxID=46969 RepID=A0A7J6VNP8_THATH|nr:Pentatricopeptide repeat-containing protein [Thalictrum thalictroides]
MNRKDSICDNLTFPFVLKACALLLAIELGKSIHGKIVKMGFSSDPFIQSGLVRMYAEFGDIEKARLLFDEIPERDIVLWNSMIGGYLKCGGLEEAQQLFESMQNKNVGSYNAMLGGYVKLGCFETASKLFNEMPDRDFISWNIMAGAHARLGSPEMAWKLFDEAPVRNLAMWSAIICGFSQGSHFGDALQMFKQMLGEGIVPNRAILVSVLSCCSHLGALEQGFWIHGYIEKHGVEVDDILGASLIDMYCKCGLLQGSISLFDKINKKGVSSWTSMIYGFAIHGHSLKALELFSEMKSAGTRPNRITFVAVLSACSHVGLIDRGREVFNEMIQVHNIKPTIEHYTCMVDLLSRANLIDEARQLIKAMPMKPDLFVWGALHGGLRIHGERKCLEDESVTEELTKLEPKDSGAYILMSNIYASNNQWENSLKMRKIMEETGVKKNLGCSLIEVDQIVHEFSAGGRLHPHAEHIYDMLDHIYREIQIF